MRVFTSQNVQGLVFYRVMKKVVPVEALQIDEEFQVPTYDGDVLSGEPGDYLICDDLGSSSRGVLSVVKQSEFKKGYRFYREDVDG
jgi:hypothetical protein